MKITGIVYVNGRRGHNTCTFEGLNTLWGSLNPGNGMFNLTNGVFFNTRYTNPAITAGDNVGRYATFDAMRGSIQYVVGMDPQGTGSVSSGTPSRGMTWEWAQSDTQCSLVLRLSLPANVVASSTEIQSLGLVLNGNVDVTNVTTPDSLTLGSQLPGTSRLFCYFPLGSPLTKVADETLNVSWEVYFSLV